MATAKSVRCRTTHVDAPEMGRLEIVWLCDEARGIRVAIAPADGGEIASIRYKAKNRWHEVLYRGMDYDPNPPVGWPGRAPILWPTVGRSYARKYKRAPRNKEEARKRLSWNHKGRVYPMPMHGFVRLMPWQLIDYGADGDSAWCVCEISDSEETRKYYPFAFTLRVTHRLHKGEITSLHEIRAGNNDEDLPFGIGNHIAFNIPFFGKGDYMQCTARTPATHNLLGAKSKWLPGKGNPVDFNKETPLGNGLYEDLFLVGYTRRKTWGELSDPFSGLTVRVTQAERPVGGKYLSKEEDFAFVYWGRPEDGQICPEPWLGISNSLNTGNHLLKLKPGGLFKWEMRVAFQPHASRTPRS